MYSAQASEQTVHEVEPGLPAPDPAADRVIEPVMRVPSVPEEKARKEALLHERDEHRSSVGRRFAPQWILAFFKRLATLAIAFVAIVMALVTWDYYVTAPWTRDGRVRVQVASVAPQISGQVIQLRVGDNQYVYKGDVLYVIDPFDFEVALHVAKAQEQERAADLQVKQVQSERRQRLSDLAVSTEQQQVFAGSAIQAQARNPSR